MSATVETLTREILDTVLRLVRPDADSKLAVGFVLNPSDEQKLRNAHPESAEAIATLDPRVERGKVETYRDERLWRERVLEQNEWDRRGMLNEIRRYASQLGTPRESA